MKKMKGIIAGACLLAFTSVSSDVFAQQGANQGNKTEQSQLKAGSISDDELKQFVQAGAKAAAVQEGSQKAMIAVVEEEKLSVEKFMEMAEAHQQQKLDEVKATTQEKAAFNRAAQRIMEMQPKIEQNMKQAIEGEGLSMEKFEQIMLVYQQDPAIQAKVQKLLEQKP